MPRYVIIGLGMTGLACVEFLLARGMTDVRVMDTREAPPLLPQLKARHPDVVVEAGEATWSREYLASANTVIVSPGISTQHPAIIQAGAGGADIIGDIELFARYNRVPVVAITGSNGKSTVTTLVGEMVRAAGKRVAVIGNIGMPVLSIDFTQPYDWIVMELSSFQLETTRSLQPAVATVLNVTADHMDRYECFQDYVDAKHRIFQGAQHVVINRDDPIASPSEYITTRVKKGFFTSQEPLAGEWGLRYRDHRTWLAWGEENWISDDELKMVGKHNLVNALSALALGMAMGLTKAPMLQALREFKGLPHRCQWVARGNNIDWFNDSKGTNVGACEASLMGLGEGLAGKIVLILGGDGKGADFTVLREAITRYCRAIIVKGKDADIILRALTGTVPGVRVNTMEEAVKQAAELACSGDKVLLSPACASWDQYRDFTHRGEVFMEMVRYHHLEKNKG